MVVIRDQHWQVEGEQAARVDVTVLVTGETGSGKEVVARAIHYLGARRNGPFGIPSMLDIGYPKALLK